MNNEITRRRNDFGLIKNIYRSAVRDGGHQEDRYLPGEIVLFSILSSETPLCRIESSFNSSNYSGGSSLGPVRMCWKEEAHIHAVCLQCMYVSSALCTIQKPKLSGWAYLHYIMLPTFLSGTAIRLILIWLFLCLISFCLGYQHTNIFSYCILRSIFAASIRLNSTSG